MPPLVSVLIPGDPSIVDDAARRALAFLTLAQYDHEIIPVTHQSLPDAFLSAPGRYIVIAPAGSGTPIKEMDKLLAALEAGADIAAGTRFHSKKGCDVQFKKGKFAIWLKTRFSGSPVADPFHGFQAFNATKMIPILQNSPDFASALKTAQRQGLKIVNIPVMYRG